MCLVYSGLSRASHLIAFIATHLRIFSCDMIDCFVAAGARDAISRDASHHHFSWDLSQNVTRTPFRSSTVGVSDCVTPGGELFMPRLGRTVMGYEKLTLQGIPFSRLLLGPETEVQ